MKYYNHLLILLFSLIGLSTFAQTSKKTLNYQAVILDPKAIDIPGASIVGQPLNKGNVCLRFSLLNAQGGLDYEETQQVTTDEYGLVNVAIGTGSQAQASNSTSIYKSFESVVWNSNVKSLKVSVSYDGCNSFKQVSAQALNYTPYALYAEAVDYKNVRDAPTKLSQFNNDAGYLIPKDLDPLKSDIQTNSSKIEVANKSIADNKQASDATFLVVNQSISSLDTKVAENTTAIKENTGSISNINTKITDQQNQISDNRNQITATNNNLNTQIGGLQGQLNTTNSTVNSLTGVAEVVSNKSTAVDLGGMNPSDQAYPSQKAAKAYVDQVVSQIATTGVPDATTLAAGKIQLSGDLGGTATSPTVPALAGKENSSNKTTATDLGAGNPSDQLYPSQKATKAYVDNSIYAAVGTGVPDATTNAAGKVKLAGDLAGTAAIPLVAKIQGSPVSSTTPTTGQVLTYNGTSWAPAAAGSSNKEDVSNKSDGALGTSTTLYPTQNAVKTYVDAQIASASIADADTNTKGKIQLAGDLSGSAAAPEITTGAVTSAKILDATIATADLADASVSSAKILDATIATADLADASVTDAKIVGLAASKVTGTVGITNGGTGATSAGDALTALGAAPLASPTFTGTVSGITATMVGLGNVTNKSEQDLAISTATATALSNKENSSNKSDDTALGNSTTLYPTQNAVKTYVNAQVSSGAPDADVNTKGKIQLAGDLAGSATSPSVVKLRGTALSTVAPVTGGHVLTYDASGSGVAYWAAPANSANTISGVVPVANGGTGLSSVTSGGAVYATSSNALATGTLPFTAGGTGAISQQTAINALTGTQSAGKYLRSNGTDATLSMIQAADVPTLNQNTTGTATNVTGTVAVSNGGTGAATLTENNVLLGNGTSALQTVAPGANGNVLTSNGTTWNSTAPSTSATTFSGSLTGDVTGTQSATVVGKINGVSLSGLNTGLLKNTTGTGEPSIASAGTDYSAGTSALSTGILKSTTTTGALSIASASDFPTLNQNTSGNAATATKLATSRTINGTGFDGSANITVTADASTLTGTALKSTVVSSSLTSVGTLANLSVTNDLTANGVTMGRGNNSRANNYAFGYQALLSASSTGGGNYNNAFGHQALTANTTGQQNSAFGEYVLPKNVGGSNNTAMGTQALRENTSGNYNTGFGHTALTTNTTGSNNTAIGYQADVSSINLTNATAIGNGAKVATSNTIQLGNTDVTNVKTSGTLTLKDVTYPNSHNTTAGQVLTINATGTASWATPTSSGSGSGGHYVGEVYGGGIVFYVTAGGYHGLIASSTDIMTSPILAIDRATSPDYHGYTTNNENLYIDWRAPTFSQLKLLREARNTAGLNLNLSSNVSYISTTTSSNDTFAFTCLRFVDNYIEYPNGNWTNDGRLVLRSIRTF